jgi:hypothetical protein
MRKRAILLLIAILVFPSIIQAHANPTWNIQTVDSDVNGGVGFGSSLVLDSNGNPRISFVDSQLRLKCAFWTGLGWQIQTIASNVASWGTSLALDSNGNPHIIYRDNTHASDLMYASWTGSRWDIENTNAASSESIGALSPLALDSNGNPHITYFDYTNMKVKYASNTGSGWKIQTIGPTEWKCYFTSLALDSNGNPHVAYQETVTTYSASLHPIYHASLKYAEWMGNEWNIQGVGLSIGYGLSLALDSKGNPYISYFDDVGGLGYAYWDGHEWNSRQLTFSDPDYGWVNAETSIRLDSSDNPHIIYYDGAENLSYTAWNGSQWSTQTVEQIKGTDVHVSLALDSEGNPHISYYNGDLKYAVFASAIQSQYSLYLVVGFTVAALILGILLFRKWKKRSRQIVSFSPVYFNSYSTDIGKHNRGSLLK